MTNALEFRGVRLTLGERVVLEDASFAVTTGEFVGVLGANGAGKTTLMRAALGLISPAAGEILVNGSPARRGGGGIGYMPQNRGAASTVRLLGSDVVTAAAVGTRWGFRPLDAAARADVDRALDLVGARELAKRPISEMSGGELQRIMLAQALLGEPRLLLLDEPLISLDPANQKQIVRLAKRLRDEVGAAVLFSAHELNPLVETIDRVLYLGAKSAVIGRVDDVVTSAILTRLYGADIEVVRTGGRIFVMSGDVDVERDAHRHEHNHDHHHA